mgnify:CR=1 FL=1
MLQSAMLQRWLRTTHKKDNMKIGKLIYDDESGEARVKFNKKFVYDMYGYEQLDLINDLRADLDEWYETIMDHEYMQGDEIAARACEDDLEEDVEYGPPIN